MFQRMILGRDMAGSFGIAAVHPLFLALGIAVDHVCRLFSAPLQARLFATNAASALWMSMAVGFFAAAARRYTGSAKAAFLAGLALGFAHMTWWMGTICEARALDLFLFSVELFLLAGWTRANAFPRGALLAFVSGLHFSVHNMALLSLPVYAFLAWRMAEGPRRAAKAACLACAWLAGAAPVLALALAEASRSGMAAAAKSVLVGNYGSQVFGLLPRSPRIFALNAALSAMSFAMPALCAALGGWRKSPAPAVASMRVPLLALLAVHALFFARYFVMDQAFFLLPTLAVAVLLVSPRLASVRRPALAAALLAAVGVLLPPVAVLAAPRGLDRGTHPGRDDARYFALPWKCCDSSCDDVVRERGLEDTWAGYLDADAAAPDRDGRPGIEEGGLRPKTR